MLVNELSNRVYVFLNLMHLLNPDWLTAKNR